MPEIKRNSIYIVGAGGFGREVHQYLCESLPTDGSFHIAGFLDDNPLALDRYSHECQIVGNVASYKPEIRNRYVIAVADPVVRHKIVKQLGPQATAYSLIHPTAYVSPTATVGAGIIIGPHSFLGPDARIADHVILNVRVTIGHDSNVESYVTFSPHAVTGGGTVIEEGCFLGTGAIVNPFKRVGGWSKISSGTVVDRNLAAGTLAASVRATNRVMFRAP